MAFNNYRNQFILLSSYFMVTSGLREKGGEVREVGETKDSRQDFGSGKI
jgi:hypothetical protein